jgi:hypothetical protein
MFCNRLGEYHKYYNFAEMDRIAQDFSDCELHNDKYTKILPIENCRFRACIANSQVLWVCDTNLK